MPRRLHPRVALAKSLGLHMVVEDGTSSRRILYFTPDQHIDQTMTMLPPTAGRWVAGYFKEPVCARPRHLV